MSIVVSSKNGHGWYMRLFFTHLNIVLWGKCEPHYSAGIPNAAWHDDVIKWKHFPRYWPFVWGIHRSPVNSPHKGQWRGALMFILICARINGWVNNREAGDLRRHRAPYVVIVMNIVVLISQGDGGSPVNYIFCRIDMCLLPFMSWCLSLLYNYKSERAFITKYITYHMTSHH